MRKGFQHLGADEGEFRLTDGAKHVLHSAKIDGILSTNCSIHLRKQGCRNDGKTDSALVNTCSKGAYVACGAAAHYQQKGVAAGFVIQQPVADFLQSCKRLDALSALDCQGGFYSQRAGHQLLDEALRGLVVNQVNGVVILKQGAHVGD